MTLSAHQKRVLAAVLALQQEHNWQWWDRTAIGYVVGAGGFHGTIQLKTVALLKDAGLIRTQRSSWTDEMRSKVNCACGTHNWGLTDKGVEVAKTIRVRWPDEYSTRVRSLAYEARTDFRDEDEPPPGWDDDDDEDDDGGPGPDDPSPNLVSEVSQ